jgi:NAD(P)H dehydrogenase (quinone)
MVAAMKGADRALIISHEFADEKRLARHKAAVQAAKDAGVGHIVYTSMPNPDAESPVPFAGDHRGTEEAIKATGIPYTILRNAWYMENLLNALPPAIKSGTWYSASGEGRVTHVTREDCARAAAGALLAGGDESRTLTVTGPDALTAREIAAIASEVTGKPITVVDVTDEQSVAALKQAGLPEPVARLVASFDTNTRLGRIGTVTDTVEQLWGSKPEGVRAFITEHRAALSA